MKLSKALLILAIPFLFLGVVSSCSDFGQKKEVETAIVLEEDGFVNPDIHLTDFESQDLQVSLTQNPIDEDKVNTGIDNTAEKVLTYIGAILAVLEIILRLIPTYSDNTVIGNIVKVLHIISDRLNRLKKK